MPLYRYICTSSCNNAVVAYEIYRWLKLEKIGFKLREHFRLTCRPCLPPGKHVHQISPTSFPLCSISLNRVPSWEDVMLELLVVERLSFLIPAPPL